MKKCSTGKPDIPKIMRLCVIQAMILLTFCCVATAHTNFAQLLERKITLEVSNMPLREVLVEIETRADVKFFYSREHVNLDARVSLHAVNMPLRTVFDSVFTDLGIQYKVHEKSGTVTLRFQGSASSNPLPAVAPNQRKGSELISGTVTDGSTLAPMPGVNIIIKGTTTGTTTNSDGFFTINAEPNDVLVFTFIGYVPVEIEVRSRTQIDITMSEDIRSLNEVVINAGYYETSKEQQTGNISRIDVEDIQKQPVSNPIAAMQGRMAGVEVIQRNGVPGGNFQVRIRGTNSIANGNDPLYIVDGVPFTSSSLSFVETSGNILGNPHPQAGLGSSPLNSINPSDIESIEVLKDADATAIYGSRGANGVVLITTRAGKEGAPRIDFSWYSGFGKVARFVDLLNTSGYLAMRKQAYKNDNAAPTQGNGYDLLLWDSTRYTDWQEELIGGTARISDGQLSMSGGGKYTRYVIGTGFHRETTVFPGENADSRVSFHSKVSNNGFSDRLTTTLSVNYSRTQSNMLSEDLTARALSLAPNAPAVRRADGSLNWDGWMTDNPLAYLERPYEALAENLLLNAVIAFTLGHGFALELNTGYTTISNEAVTTTPVSSLHPTRSVLINRSAFSESSFQNWIAEPQIKWKKEWGHSAFDVLAGATFLSQVHEGLAQVASGFASEALMKNLGAASSVQSGTNYFSQYRYNAFFGRFNYAFRNRYLINITGRRDGSSRFGPKNQFANFGAAGVAWIFSAEKFMKALPFSYGKLRASYGTTGSDQIGDYKFLDAYSSSGPYLAQVGLMPSRLYNPDFGWETTRKAEVALELGLFDDRIMLTGSVYRNRSSNQLLALPLSATTGFSSIQGNFGATVENRGLEIELSSQNLVRESFTWTTSVNISIPRNELIEFEGLEASPEYASLYEVGYPLNIRKLYRYEGVDPATGLHTVADIDGNGVYNSDDRRSLKFTGTHLFGGLQNTLSVKGIELTFLMQFVRQDGMSYQRLFPFAPGTLQNQPKSALAAWQEQGDPTSVQRYTTRGVAVSAYNRYRESDVLISDVSFMRLKNLSLAYRLPSRTVDPLGLRTARFFIQGQNLLTFTRYKGFDPENQSGLLPPLRTLTAGLHLQF